MRFFLISVAALSLAVASMLGMNRLGTHVVLIEDGSSVARVMRQDGAFSSVGLFWIVDHVPKLRECVLAGEYLVPENINILSFIRMLLSGKTIRYRVTFPEGYTVWQIVQQLNREPMLQGDIKEMPMEGSLFPSTYFFRYKTTRQAIIDNMKAEMLKIKQWIKQENKTGLSVEQIIILASIIEKEVHKETDRKLVASVYHNRLKKNMRLQSDPTVIYGLTVNGVYQGMRDKLNILNKDLFDKSKYNTYRNNGLPPGPICCPGKASIAAAMDPVKSDYLYFISDIAADQTYFSVTFQEHIQMKKKLRSKAGSRP